jgi:hypothetical protein
MAARFALMTAGNGRDPSEFDAKASSGGILTLRLLSSPPLAVPSHARNQDTEQPQLDLLLHLPYAEQGG